MTSQVKKVNESFLKSVSEKLSTRTEILIKIPTELLSPQTVQILVEEFFLNLEIISELVKSLNIDNSWLTADSNIKVSTMLKKQQSLFARIIIYMKDLAHKNLNCSESLEQLWFIISEFFLSFSSNISLDQIKLYTFLYSINTDLFEVCEFLIQQTKSSEIKTHEDHTPNTNECLKSILTEFSLQVLDIERSTSLFERLKLISVAFMCKMSVDCLQLSTLTNKVVINQQTDTEINSNFVKYGKHLKNIIFHFIFTTYMCQDELHQNDLRIKEDILSQTDSSSYHTMSLLIFLDGFGHGTCSVLSFNEFKFCLSLVESLYRNDYFSVFSDPLINKSFMNILNQYSEYMLMLSAFFTWYNR